MFEKYIVCPDTLRNVSQGGAVTGFAFDVRLAYYRGLALSMVEGFDVSVDGESFSPDSIVFGVAGERFTFAELEMEIEARWEFTEVGTVFVSKPGGLAPGGHAVSVVEILRISYMAQPARRVGTRTMQIA